MQAGGGAPNTEHLDLLKKGLTPPARRAHRLACGRATGGYQPLQRSLVCPLGLRPLSKTTPPTTTTASIPDTSVISPPSSECVGPTNAVHSGKQHADRAHSDTVLAGLNTNLTRDSSICSALAGRKYLVELPWSERRNVLRVKL
jgi:hypothetical protein